MPTFTLTPAAVIAIAGIVCLALTYPAFLAGMAVGWGVSMLHAHTKSNYPPSPR